MTPHTPAWQPLRLLESQFSCNVAALTKRDPDLANRLKALQPANEFFVSAENNRLQLARSVNQQIEPLPERVNPSAAGQIAMKLFPSGKCTEPVFIAGLDQGWLWNALYELEIHTPAAPGHTPPLYFLTPDIERLWMVLHFHEWKKLLADPRTRLFAGPNAVGQAQQSMAGNLHLPIPKLCVTVDPATWSNGASIDTVTGFALNVAGSRMKQLKTDLDACYADADPAAAFAEGRKLRIMGITSRFTTFLQYSMRDWLGAFESLGHETLLVIEPDDASQSNPIVFAEQCARFQPDLIVMLDHYRGEFAGLPANVPFVMWVQDHLPNIFSDRAGAAQGRYDYTIGYGRIDCVYKHRYAGDRFMPAMIGTNEHRFHPRRLTGGEYALHACDVSFVSHCSTPADVLLRQEMARHNSPEIRRVFDRVFEQLKSQYDAGGSVTVPARFQTIIDEALRGANLTIENPDPLLNFFTHKINNALYRHQTLHWLSEMDVRIRLYGRGWEQHPQFAQYACGVADNEEQLSAIYQASRINLHVSPFGAAHQRVFDGLAAGGFFLLRQCPGDRVDLINRELWNWCERNGITNDAHLRAEADAQAIAWLEELAQIHGESLFGHGYDFVHELGVVAAGGFTRSASTLWPEHAKVAFATRDELQARVKHYLKDDADRAIITRSMRQRVLDCMTYRAIAAQTIEFVANDLLATRDAAQAEALAA